MAYFTVAVFRQLSDEFVVVYVNVKFSDCFTGFNIDAQRLGSQDEPEVKGCGHFNIFAPVIINVMFHEY